jgi:hypothetical protein
MTDYEMLQEIYADMYGDTYGGRTENDVVPVAPITDAMAPVETVDEDVPLEVMQEIHGKSYQRL